MMAERETAVAATVSGADKRTANTSGKREMIMVVDLFVAGVANIPQVEDQLPATLKLYSLTSLGWAFSRNRI